MRPLAYANALSLLLVVAGAALLLVALHALERRASRYVAHRLGWRGVLVTAWLGVPCHELGHLAMARLFGHRIVAWRLFDPDPTSGTLGYVLSHVAAADDATADVSAGALLLGRGGDLSLGVPGVGSAQGRGDAGGEGA